MQSWKCPACNSPFTVIRAYQGIQKGFVLECKGNGHRARFFIDKMTTEFLGRLSVENNSAKSRVRELIERAQKAAA